MARKYARGHAAWGECGRCAARRLLNAMVFDGQYPNMRVCPACYEPKHPQENLKRIDDPVALWRPAPENLQFDPPVLTGELWDGPTVSDAEIRLSWTRAYSGTTHITGYTLYRSVAGGEFEVLEDSEIVRDFLGGIVSGELLEYVDTDVVDGTHYDYYVIAHAVSVGDAQSNTVAIDFEDLEYQATTPVLSITLVDGSIPVVSLAWTASTIHNGTIDYYELFRSDLSDVTPTFTHLADIDGDTLVYDDTTIEGGPGYQYYVVARVVAGIDSEDSNIVDTGFIFTGTVVTDLRFNSSLLLDSATPGLTYILRPIPPDQSLSDQPQLDSGRAFFPGNWASGSSKSDITTTTPTSAIDLSRDWTIEVELETAFNVPLGGFPTPVAVAIGTISGAVTIEQASEAGAIRVTLSGNGGTTVISSGVDALVGESYSVVVTRSGTTVSLYVDGVLTATGTYTPLSTAALVRLGYSQNTDQGNVQSRWRGWLDNFRFIQDQAVPP